MTKHLMQHQFVESPSSSLRAFSLQDPPPLSSNPNIFIAHQKGTHGCTQRSKLDHPYLIFACVSYSSLPNTSRSFIASLNSITIPKTITKALSHPGWHAATEKEIITLEANEVFDIVSLPRDKNPINRK